MLLLFLTDRLHSIVDFRNPRNTIVPHTKNPNSTAHNPSTPSFPQRLQGDGSSASPKNATLNHHTNPLATTATTAPNRTNASSEPTPRRSLRITRAALRAPSNATPVATAVEQNRKSVIIARPTPSRPSTSGNATTATPLTARNRTPATVNAPNKMRFARATNDTLSGSGSASRGSDCRALSAMLPACCGERACALPDSRSCVFRTAKPPAVSVSERSRAAR